MVCDSCTLEYQHLVGALIDGTYGQYCKSCVNGLKRPANTGIPAYNRAKDYDDHEVDLLQPWDRKGNPSKQFIEHYPEEAHDIFTKEELEQYG